MTGAAPVPLSVVIPAHDEAAVIGRCLSALTKGSEHGELELVVVCNGCSDETAAVARSSWPAAIVMELPAASKVDALNAGDAIARHFPRFFVDADVTVTIDALRATAQLFARDERVLCAAPRPTFDLAARPWVIRAFYDTWNQLPYLNEDVVGSGVYALSMEGRRRFARFPPVTADDQFVLESFPRGERRTVPNATFTVHPPTSLLGLLRIRRRAYRGAREVARVQTARHTGSSSAQALVSLARRPRRVPALAVYVAVSIAARAAALWSRSTAWERDDSGRTARL